VTAPTLDGWLIIRIGLLHENVTGTTGPVGRVLDQTLPDLIFHTVACRDAWCTRAHVRVP
jgi:hypothetical protein